MGFRIPATRILLSLIPGWAFANANHAREDRPNSTPSCVIYKNNGFIPHKVTCAFFVPVKPTGLAHTKERYTPSVMTT